MKHRLIIPKEEKVQIAYKLFSNEVACKCNLPTCHFTLIDPELLKLWDYFRVKWGKPVNINSGFRCQTHNVNVGGAFSSQHTQGGALDLALPNSNTAEFIALAKRIFPFVLIYDTFIHVDIRFNK